MAYTLIYVPPETQLQVQPQLSADLAFGLLTSGTVSGAGGSVADLVNVGHWDDISVPSNTLDSLLDVGADTPWDSLSTGYLDVLQVIDASSLGFTSANCLRTNVLLNGASSRACSVQYDGLPLASNGDDLFLRWEIRSGFPNPYPHGDSSQHPIENDPPSNSLNWSFYTLAGDGNWTFRLYCYELNESGDNNRFFTSPTLNNDQTYRIEIQFHRISDTMYWMKCWITDVATGVELYGPEDFNAAAGGDTLADEPTLEFNSLSDFNWIQAGSNGLASADAGSDGDPLWYFGRFSYRTEGRVGE